VIEVLEGGDVSEHFTDRNEPPYPHVRLLDPPGSDRGLQHGLAPLLQIEVLGDLDGSHSKPLLRRILYVILGALAELPDIPAQPGQSVVSYVESSGGGGYVPEPTGQPRYIATVRMHMHPGVPVAG
jgi:hypothetical protein